MYIVQPSMEAIGILPERSIYFMEKETHQGEFVPKAGYVSVIDKYEI